MRRFNWCIFKLTLNEYDEIITIHNRSFELIQEIQATDELIDLFRRADGSLKHHIYMHGMHDNLTGRVSQLTLAKRQAW